MPAIDFPNSPSLNQEFTAGGTIYVWNGTVWRVKSSDQPPSSSIVSYSANAPANPVAGQVWVESDVNINTIDTTTLYTKTEVDSALLLKANLASPTLTGVPSAPTAAAATNTTQIATTAFVRTEVSNLVASAPTALDTLNELATALGNDASFSTTITNSLAGKEPTITAGTTGQYWRGDKSWQTLDKSAVGLSNVENTALSTWTGSANLTTLGTVTGGTWNGSSISATYIDSAIARLASPTFTGIANFASINVSGMLDAQEIRESVVDVSLSSNVGTLNWTDGNIYYISVSPTGNMTLNVTNVPTDISKMMTINIFVTQGATGYIPSTFQIDGSSQTIRWPGGSAPTPTSSAGKIDIFSFTMQRTSGGSWIVYGASSLNF